MLEGAMKSGAFAAADAFILPSHQENFGLAVVEAMSAGLPALISDRVNIWREVAEEGAGYVAADNLDGTKRLISRWLEASPPEREQMRRNAQLCYERRFSADRAADALLNVLNET